MEKKRIKLPMSDCGSCGFKTCSEFSDQLDEKPDLIKRCIYSSGQTISEVRQNSAQPSSVNSRKLRLDSLGREFDFILELFPEDPGPREVILPHNPMLTREMNIAVGDILIGRPLGMSCGCPVTHCGVVMEVDQRIGVIVWCVTGPLKPRKDGFKDIGYYAAEAYEGLITEACCEIRIGQRYFFQPKMCMLQWRHSGLVNYMNKTPDGLQVRLEGLWIG